TAYGVLSRGLLSGSRPTAPGDFRSRLPRFSGANRDQNDRLVEVLRQIATEQQLRPAQLAIAWVLAASRNIVPVIGARTRAQLGESLAALQVMLTPEDIARIENAVPASAVAGTRYDVHQMQMLDSERGTPFN